MKEQNDMQNEHQANEFVSNHAPKPEPEELKPELTIPNGAVPVPETPVPETKPEKPLEGATPVDGCVPYPVAATKSWRRTLDLVLQEIKHDSERDFKGLRHPKMPIRSSRERSLAITKIEEAIMWLGMDLKAQNEPNPYPHSYNPASPVIDPTADGLKM